MKNKLFIVLLLLFCTSIFYGQFYDRNNRVVVFNDEANVRESPSITSKIVVTLKHGNEAIVCDQKTVPDTVNGIFSDWIPVLYNGISGYMWQHTLATNAFTHTNGNRLLVKNDAKGLVYKVFEKDRMISTGSFPDKPNTKYSHISTILPLFAVKENLYIKLRDSDVIYSFDGLHVKNAGTCDEENIYSLHQSSQKKVPDSITSSIITGDHVNFRDAPNLDSKIIGGLSKYSYVEVIEQIKKGEEIGGEFNYWYKITYKGKVGYVWGKSLSTPRQQIYDNDDPNTTYLMCNNALIVLQKGEIMASCPLSMDNGSSLHSFGDLGFGKGYDFIATEHLAESCGIWGGDVYYLWDGKNLKHFCSSGGVGDGGLSDGEEYVFPSEQRGIPGKILKHAYSSELIDIIPIDDCEENYTDVFEYNETSIMHFNGEALVEGPSRYLALKQLVESEFPNYKLVQSTFGDLNGDGMEDAVFEARKEIYTKEYHENGELSYKNKIGIALGKNPDAFEIISVNDHLIGNQDDYRPNIYLDASGITVVVYFEPIPVEDYYDMKRFGRKIYHFTYHTNDQKIYWESFSSVTETGLDKSLFKTKKILFKDAWSYTYEEDASGY